MGEDGEGTLAALKAIRRELAEPKIAERRGRIVKTTGDGLFVEFANVVDAVRCAVEVQQAMEQRNADIAEVRCIRFRSTRLGESATAAADKPSLAVLPFQNMSGDPEQEYFADGMVEDHDGDFALRHRAQFELHVQGPRR